MHTFVLPINLCEQRLMAEGLTMLPRYKDDVAIRAETCGESGVDQKTVPEVAVRSRARAACSLVQSRDLAAWSHQKINHLTLDK